MSVVSGTGPRRSRAWSLKPTLWAAGVFVATVLSGTNALAQQFVYVANSGLNTVSVIAAASNTVVATITVGNGPTGVAITPDGTQVYVTNQNDNTVSVIATKTNTVTATITNSGFNVPIAVAITPDGTHAYVVNFGSPYTSTATPGTVSVIATTTNPPTVVGSPIPVGFAPTWVAITPDGAHVYVTNQIDNTVSVIGTATNPPAVTTTLTGFNAPFGVAIAPNGDAYVTNAGTGAQDGTVSVISTSCTSSVETATPSLLSTPAVQPQCSKTCSPTVVATIPVGLFPQGVAITPNGTYAYVTNSFDSTVSVIATATNTVSATISNPAPPAAPSLSQPTQIAITPDGAFVYITNNIGGSNPDSVSVITTATNSVSYTIGGGNSGVFSGPSGVAIASSGPVTPSAPTSAPTSGPTSGPTSVPTSVPTSGTACNGTYNGTFKGDITVKAGQTCIFVGGGVKGNVTMTGGNLTLTGATVTGSVQARSGNLTLTQSTIDGSVQIQDGKFAIATGTDIKGNLQIEDQQFGAATNQVCGTKIEGDLQVQNNWAALLVGAAAGAGNTIKGNLQIQYNAAPANVDGNTVDGDLQVQFNWGPTVVDGNTVTGDLHDQYNIALTQVFSNVVGGNLQCSGDFFILGGGNTARSKQGQCAHF